MLISRMEGEAISLHSMLLAPCSERRGPHSSLDIFGGSLVVFDELVAKSLSVVGPVGLAGE